MFDYFRRKRITNNQHKIYGDWDKFKEIYGFELRDVDPSVKGNIEYNLDYIRANIENMCKKHETLYNRSFIFNGRFKLNIEDLVDVTADLPFHLLLPVFDKYFPDIKKFFLKEFIENGLENTYEEVKNKIVNYADMRYIIDPMNVAINKTLDYVSNKYCTKKKNNKIDKIISKVSSNTWFGNKNDGFYEISLANFFIAYSMCDEEKKKNNKGFWKIFRDGISSAIIVYLWYITCDYFYNSKDKKISYIRTDVEMFYMRCIHANCSNYINFNNIFTNGKKEMQCSSFDSLIKYYSKYVAYMQVMTREGSDYVSLLKRMVDLKEKYGDETVKLPEEKTTELMEIFSGLENHILVLREIINSRYKNTVDFNPFERLLECIFDRRCNGVEICRPSLYLDLSTPESEYIKNETKEIK